MGQLSLQLPVTPDAVAARPRRLALLLCDRVIMRSDGNSGLRALVGCSQAARLGLPRLRREDDGVATGRVAVVVVLLKSR